MTHEMEDKATPRPWLAFDYAGSNMRSYSQSSGVSDSTHRKIICGCFFDIGGEEVASANAALIVHRVNNYEKLREALQRVETAMDLEPRHYLRVLAREALKEAGE